MFFYPNIPEDLSDDDNDNDYGEDEEEDDDGGDSDFDAKEASKGRQATAKRKRAAGITSINTSLHSHSVTSDNYFLCMFGILHLKKINAQYV